MELLLRSRMAPRRELTIIFVSRSRRIEPIKRHSQTNFLWCGCESFLFVRTGMAALLALLCATILQRPNCWTGASLRSVNCRRGDQHIGPRGDGFRGRLKVNSA